MKTTLYSKDVTNAIRVWAVEIKENGLEITHGVMGGSIQTKFENIKTGKGSRTLEGQIRSRFFSRVNAQFDKGYVETLEEAKTQKRTNAIGMLRPMLAKSLKNVRNIKYDSAFYQHKYDGNRCLVTKQDGITFAYSRNGKPLKAISHILSGIRLKEGETIDGELYCHGVPLQTICSWIKREQDATKSLDYRVYDLMVDRPYKERLDELKSMNLGDHAEVVPTLKVHTEEVLEELLENSLTNGYEGGILRWGGAGYEDGKRSKSLIKIKTFMDDEFIVIDVVESKDGWARLECETNQGEGFMVSAPGSMSQRYEIMNNFEQYLGRMVTVKFANWTKDKVPFHPVAVAFRDDL